MRGSGRGGALLLEATVGWVEIWGGYYYKLHVEWKEGEGSTLQLHTMYQ